MVAVEEDGRVPTYVVHAVDRDGRARPLVRCETLIEAKHVRAWIEEAIGGLASPR